MEGKARDARVLAVATEGDAPDRTAGHGRVLGSRHAGAAEHHPGGDFHFNCSPTTSPSRRGRDVDQPATWPSRWTVEVDAGPLQRSTPAGERGASDVEAGAERSGRGSGGLGGLGPAGGTSAPAPGRPSSDRHHSACRGSGTPCPVRRPLHQPRPHAGGDRLRSRRAETMAGRWAARRPSRRCSASGPGKSAADIEIERLPTGQPR